MFDEVSNKFDRQKLISLLTFIVEATRSPSGYGFVPNDEARKLANAEPGFIVLDPSITNNGGQIKAVATEAAIKAFSVDNPSTAKSGVLKEPSNYKIVSLEFLPPIMRGGRKGDSYPFHQLKPFPEPGNAFFVPATSARPNPAKNLASTVASANKRHAKTDNAVFTVRQAKDASGKVIGAHVIRTA